MNHSRPDFVIADVCQNEWIEVCKEKFSQFEVEAKEIALGEAKDSLLDIDIVSFEEYSSKLEEAKNRLKEKTIEKYSLLH